MDWRHARLYERQAYIEAAIREKKKKQLVFKTRVNAECFGKGVNKALKKLLVEELIEEHIAAVIDPCWHGARVFNLKPFRLEEGRKSRAVRGSSSNAA